LLAKAVCQLPEISTEPALSRASPLPQGGMGRPCLRRNAWRFQSRNHAPGFTPLKNVGAGLPAKAVYQSPEISTEPALSRASPLPQWGMGRPCLRRKAWRFQPRNHAPGFTPLKNVGAGLLAKAVYQSPELSTEAALSRASPLPHCGMGRPCLRRNAWRFQPRNHAPGFTPLKNVGAGLLAKAVYQSPEISTEAALSRASPLPQGGCGARLGDFNRATTPQASHRSKMWERACPRRRCISHRKYRLNQRFREQAHSHMGECGVHAGRARPGNIPGTPHI